MEHPGILDLEVRNRMAVLKRRDVVVDLLTREVGRHMVLRVLRAEAEWVLRILSLEEEEHIGRLPCRNRDSRTFLPKRMSWRMYLSLCTP